MNELKIIVVGGVGTGRTSMMALLEKALTDAGFASVTVDHEYVTEREFQSLSEMVDTNTKWKTNTNIKISEIQTARTQK